MHMGRAWQQKIESTEPGRGRTDQEVDWIEKVERRMCWHRDRPGDLRYTSGCVLGHCWIVDEKVCGGCAKIAQWQSLSTGTGRRQ